MKVDCPKCASIYEIDSDGTFKCPKCGNFFTIKSIGGMSNQHTLEESGSIQANDFTLERIKCFRKHKKVEIDKNISDLKNSALWLKITALFTIASICFFSCLPIYYAFKNGIHSYIEVIYTLGFLFLVFVVAFFIAVPLIAASAFANGMARIIELLKKEMSN